MVSGTGPVAGWINTKVWDETHDAQKRNGWTSFVLDTNGNGKRDDFTEPDQPADAAKDARITGGSGPYAVMPNPKDGSIWYTVGVFGGQAGFLRFDPKTQLSEFYKCPKPGVGIRGGDIDANGVALGFGVERPPRQLRPAQVQRHLLTDRTQPATIVRKVGVLQISRSGL